MTSTDKVRVLLDTDIASDIDDAVALSYLLRQERCDLLGITTVTGDVAKRAACAEVLCNEMGRGDIPIHIGASPTLVLGPGQPLVPQYDAIRNRPHRMDWPANTAVDFLRQTIRKYPGEIVLLSIGPFTNIALLFALDPEIPSLLKQFVSMAGSFFPAAQEKVPREWNVLVDPVASWMIYNRDYAFRTPHVSIGLDVTLQCEMQAPDVRAKFNAKPLDVVREMAEVWFKSGRAMTFHDPLAAALIFEPELCVYARGRVTVPTDVDDKAGRTMFTRQAGGPHVVSESVKADAFLEHFFSICS